jgi:hypothetical protein
MHTQHANLPWRRARAKPRRGQQDNSTSSCAPSPWLARGPFSQLLASLKREGGSSGQQIWQENVRSLPPFLGLDTKEQPAGASCRLQEPRGEEEEGMHSSGLVDKIMHGFSIYIVIYFASL